MSERPLYENQYIGAFIYALGVIAGRKGINEGNSFNLVQQTPGERQIVGDLFVKWQGLNFIIEFKRTHWDLESEKKKSTCIRLLKKLEEDDNFRRLSHNAHFIGFGYEMVNQVDIRFHQYLILRKERSNYQHGSTSLKGFIDGVIGGQIGVDAKDLKSYFKSLSEIPTDTDSFSGVIINIDKNGMPNLVKFGSAQIMELDISMTMDQSIDKTQQKGIGM